MTRALLAIAIVAALVASGTVLTKQIRERGVRDVFTQLGKNTSVSNPKTELLRAANALETDHAVKGTFTRTDLSRFRGVMLVYASLSAYCVQIAKGQSVYHLAGPGGAPADGGC